MEKYECCECGKIIEIPTPRPVVCSCGSKYLKWLTFETNGWGKLNENIKK